DFLWWLRNELHYVTKRKTDKLSFEVQHTIAKNLGYSDKGSILAEEAMMRDYYLRAEHLSEFTSLIINIVNDREWAGSRIIKLMRSIKLSDGFSITDREISFQPGQADFSTYPTRIMRLFVHKQQLGYSISSKVTQAVIANLHLIDEEFQSTRANTEAFLSILGNSAGVAETLRAMHRLEVLDCYLPEFSKVRSLVRYDRPHQYTVDEHTMYAIENLEEQALAEVNDGQTFIEMLNSLEKPELLRLAVLYHDVGKGIEGPEDHDRRSVDAAKAMLDRFSLPDEDREIVLFLISNHLEMSHTAQHRDLDDPKTIEQFARLVGNEQKAMMLYLLTFADMRAVSTNIWTEWSATLLRSLYDRTIKYLRGEAYRIELDSLQKQVGDLIGESIGEDAIDQHFDAMSDQQLIGNSPAFICKQIELVEQLGDNPIAVSCFQDSKFHTQIGICTRDHRGTFRKITGVIAAEKVNIMSADIATRSDGIVIDTICLSDETTRSGLSAEHRDRLVDALCNIWIDEVDFEAVLKQLGESDPSDQGRRDLTFEVVVDNSGSDSATIIDIRAQDRVGFLYLVAALFHDLNINVRIAKVTTEDCTVMDAFYAGETNGTTFAKANRIEEIKNTFYVTEPDGQKITAPDRIEEFKKSLTDRLSVQ
ncbi:MAG: HD domain-containing protein, partial [Candidatus Poribacteria bacterium]|nr:HD domain-containing protein [Candidatus Poribacteria bacterium]